MSLSIAQKVSDFNYLFGVIPAPYTGKGVKNVHLFDKHHPQYNDNQYNLRKSLIFEEIKELREAYADKNVIEIIDALCDILYVVYGAIVYFNLTNNEMLMDTYKYFKVKPLDIHRLENEIFDNPTIKHEINFLGNNIIDLMNIENRNFEDFNGFQNYLCLYETYLVNIIKSVLSITNEMSIDLDKFFTIVHNSNMSKICKSEEEAIRSIDYYKNVETRYNDPRYRVTYLNDVPYYIIYDEETKKILKSIDYTKAIFL